MRYAPIDNRLFKENRARLARRLAPRSAAIFNSNDVMPKSGDGVRRFIQQTDLFYLSGIDQEETILMICPDAREPKHREILFIRETSETIAVWEGRKFSRAEAAAVSGIDQVYWTSDFPRIFRKIVLESDRLYLNTNEHPRADLSVETRDDRFIRWCRDHYPLHRYERVAPILHELRSIKSSMEIALIREAVAITKKAFQRVLKMIRSGVWEFELEAEILHEFLKNRSRGPAYEPIIASGKNTCVLHYVKNDQCLKDGDLVLMDFGAEYAGYAADLTRTVPVNGRFTDRQRAVYRAVLDVQQKAIEMLYPGNTFEAYHQAVGNCMEKALIGLGLITLEEVKHQDPEEPLYKKYYMHGTSHPLGLDVHDYGRIDRPFEPGMVLTCEPGIYIPEEGIGVRMENDILIGPEGPEDLTADIPLTDQEIEAWMSPTSISS